MILRATCPECGISTRFEEGGAFRLCGHVSDYLFETEDGEPVLVEQVVKPGVPNAP